jgi:hypothetical protein
VSSSHGNSAWSAANASQNHAVDMNRLNSIYTAHRASFWAAVANDYGAGASPVVLETAWRNSVATSGSGQTPITPIGSPDDHIYGGSKSQSVPPQGDNASKTRISAILGIDANPRSPREREMVRSMEGSMGMVGMVGA